MKALEIAVSNTSPQRGEARSALRPHSGARQVGRGEKHAWTPTPVPPALLQTARDLRQHMTDAEQRLWHCLRGKQLDGFRFRKQHPIAHFVLDFTTWQVIAYEEERGI